MNPGHVGADGLRGPANGDKKRRKGDSETAADMCGARAVRMNASALPFPFPLQLSENSNVFRKSARLGH